CGAGGWRIRRGGAGTGTRGKTGSAADLGWAFAVPAGLARAGASDTVGGASDRPGLRVRCPAVQLGLSRSGCERPGATVAVTDGSCAGGGPTPAGSARTGVLAAATGL